MQDLHMVLNMPQYGVLWKNNYSFQLFLQKTQS